MVSLLPSTTEAAAAVITDVPSMCAEHIKRINSSEFFDNSPAAAVDLCSVYDITVKTRGK